MFVIFKIIIIIVQASTVAQIILETEQFELRLEESDLVSLSPKFLELILKAFSWENLC